MGVRGQLRDFGGLRCYVKCKDVSNFGTEKRVWEPEWVRRSPSERARRIGQGKSPGSCAEHPSFLVPVRDLGFLPQLGDRGRGQPMVTGNANDGCPNVDPGCRCDEEKGRGLDADSAAISKPGQNFRQCGDGRRDMQS